MRTICFTSDKRTWALRAFAHQWAKYAPVMPFEFAGYTDPGPKMTLGHTFHSIGKFEDYPLNKWSDGIIKFLESIDDELFIYTMEDFWLRQPADVDGIKILEKLMLKEPSIARIDLSYDRATNPEVSAWGTLAWLDMLMSKPYSSYHFSLQMGIWRRQAFLDCLEPGESPWEAEVNGSPRLANLGALVLGTRQPPMRYLIAVQQGKVTLDGGYQIVPSALIPDDQAELEDWGYLNVPS